MRETDEIQTDAPGHCRRYDRQCARVVRLCDLRLFRDRDRPSFFPHEDPVAQSLSAFGVFALGYLMRPVGGALIGHIGDRFGRRAALTVSVAAMAIPTFLIGLLPGYATLGLLAPIALTLLRMVQRTFGRRRIYQLDGIPGRARTGRPPRLDGCFDVVRRVRRHPARLGRRSGFRGDDVHHVAQVLGVAHPVPARPRGGARRLRPAPARARYRARRAAQARADRGNPARSLAHRSRLRRLVRVQRGRLLCQLRLSRELAADRRRHGASARTRNQLGEHGPPAACS